MIKKIIHFVLPTFGVLCVGTPWAQAYERSDVQAELTRKTGACLKSVAGQMHSSIYKELERAGYKIDEKETADFFQDDPRYHDGSKSFDEYAEEMLPLKSNDANAYMRITAERGGKKAVLTVKYNLQVDASVTDDQFDAIGNATRWGMAVKIKPALAPDSVSNALRPERANGIISFGLYNGDHEIKQFEVLAGEGGHGCESLATFAQDTPVPGHHLADLKEWAQEKWSGVLDTLNSAAKSAVSIQVAYGAALASSFDRSPERGDGGTARMANDGGVATGPVSAPAKAE